MYRAGRLSTLLGPFSGLLLFGCGVIFAQTDSPAPAKSTISDAQVEASVLKALAGAQDLSNQSITTTTVYGVVTLSGTVQTEAQRTEAENLAARTIGVQKVVDEMTLPSETSTEQAQAQAQAQAGAAPLPESQQQEDAQGSNPDLQSDGTIAPQGQASPAQPAGSAAEPTYGPGAPEYRPPYGSPQQPQGPYNQSPYGQAPPSAGYPQQGPPAYPQQGYPQQSQQPYPQGQQGYYGAPAYSGQQAGETVTIPSGALVRMRINETLDSARAQSGQHFDGIVVNDVVAGGAVAIPRGATVHGVVIDARKSGALSGRGELSLQLTEITLGGKTYAISSDVWAHNGADKSVQSVGSTALGGGIGALIGAAAGGGAGAAIGAGLGGALGLGSSAASHSGQVFVPAEGLLTFHLSQPVTVSTVSQQEMDRLAQSAGPSSSGAPQRLQRRYPYPYYGPVYYRPYPYGYPYPY